MKTLFLFASLLIFPILSLRAETAPEKPVDISRFRVTGDIRGENITFTLDFHARVNRIPTEIKLIEGELVFLRTLAGEGVPEAGAPIAAEPYGGRADNGNARPGNPLPSSETQLPEGAELRYAPEEKAYYLLFARKLDAEIKVCFAVSGRQTGEEGWKSATFSTPTSRVRELEVVCDRTDLEVQFPGALKQVRSADSAGRLKITALLGPGKPFAVSWKPRVGELEGKLVLSSDANTVATVSAGALRMDSLYAFTVAQGKLRELTFTVPDHVSITQVRCPFIRDWKLVEEGGRTTLHVILNRPVVDMQPVQIISETVLGGFPLDLTIPVIQPLDVIRASGHISIGTNSAVQLLVSNTGGLSQIDAEAFPRMVLTEEFPRPLPRSKAFFYAYATTPYQLTISLADIIPAYDASSSLVFRLKEDNLTMTASLELDIRDAGIRELKLLVDSGLVISGVTGAEVDDFSVLDELDSGGLRAVTIQFKNAVVGRVLLDVQAETGSSPIGEAQQLRGICVAGAESQRGYVVLAADKGVHLGEPVFDNLRKVHTGSLPVTVANAQFAFRFRDPVWTLGFSPSVKPASVQVESFHLLSVAEGITYGTMMINYFISGSPQDEFHFRIPAAYKNVEFVGRDVRRWDRSGDIWVVKLQRKVIGDFNLGVTFNQRPGDENLLLAGGIVCAGVETENGYIAITSGLNLALNDEAEPSTGMVLEIKQDELPANYRLLAKLPILKSYKYVGHPHEKHVKIVPFAQGEVLPVLIEVMEARTKINVNNDGQTQAVTRIRYKVKNSSSQYLNLNMPAETAYWTVRRLDTQSGDTGMPKNVVAQRNQTTGMLMIPLERRRNPNAPMTIELEYGQVFGKLNWFDTLTLEAPGSPVKSTYSQWVVEVADPLAVKPRPGGTMLVGHSRDRQSGGMTLLAVHLGSLWGQAAAALAEKPVVPAMAFTILVLLLLPVAIFRPGALLPGAVGGLFAGVCLLGLLVSWQATDGGLTVPGANLQQVNFTQALGLDSSAGARVSVNVMPAWLGVVSPPFLLGWGGALILGGVVGWFRKGTVLGRAGWALGAVSLVSLGLLLPAGHWVAIHILSWVLPAAVALSAGLSALKVSRLHPPRPATPAAAAGLLLAACCLASSPASGMASSTPPFAGYGTVTHRVDVNLEARNDHMQVDVALELETLGPLTIPLVETGAVLMTPEKVAKNVHILQQENMYVCTIDRLGTHAFTIRFLVPMPPVEESQPRTFSLPLPVALTNAVRLIIPRTGMDISAQDAVRFSKQETRDSTIADAIFAPGRPLSFSWRPRSRETKRETTSYFAETSSLFRFDSGLADGRHNILFQIARGELKDMVLGIPEGMTVTAVSGRNIGAWRFDPTTRQAEIKLSEAATGTYVLTVATQMASDKLPATFMVRTLDVPGAIHQRGTIGIVTTPAVYATLEDHPPALNLNDYLRESQKLLGTIPGLTEHQVRHAFRVAKKTDQVRLTINEVRPEIRTAEQSGFVVSDDRLLYNGTFVVDIAKAGMFAIDLLLTGDYDIDSLTAPGVSHWDEIDKKEPSVGTGTARERVVRIHFANKLMGQCQLSFALSRPVAELPPDIKVPTLRAEGALKHGGGITVSAAHGIRLTVKPGEREGVSELDSVQGNIRDEQALAFKLLKPDWRLGLAAEVIEPRVNVDYLHIARISEGMVRHRHHLRYRLHNAGSKFFDIQVPRTALGLQISGPNIARMEEVAEASGQWRIELADKVLTRPFPLTVSYETQFDQGDGGLTLESVRPLHVDLQRGFIVAFASDRIELYPSEATRQSMQPVDPRTVPAKFGQEDLSGAAFCYSSAGGGYSMGFQAVRHQAADLLTAEVRSARLETVVTDKGEMITKVDVQMLSGDLRHLAVSLPPGADLWGLVINGGATIPSRRQADGRDTILIPLAQTMSAELLVNIQFIYVARPQPEWSFEKQLYQGPEFDLPLKNISWTLYVPDHWRAAAFAGTLNVDEQAFGGGPGASVSYDLDSYEDDVARQLEVDLRNARELQNKGFELAREGNAYEAKQALEWAYNYSYADPALNEDARVQLNKMMQEQAVAGLVQRRGGLRQKASPSGAQTAQAIPIQPDGRANGQGLDAQTVTRLHSSLSKTDSENLENIIDRVIEVQEAAAGNAVQLVINMPLRGRRLHFSRPLQVKPNAPLTVSFEARRQIVPAKSDFGAAAILGLVVMAFLSLASAMQVWAKKSRAAADLA